MNGFPIVKCPNCFCDLSYNNAVFRCNFGSRKTDFYLEQFCADNSDYARNLMLYDYVDPANLKRSQIIMDEDGYIKGIEMPESPRMIEQRLCPYCHNVLIKGYGKRNVRYIAVVGAPSSGKTTYLAALNASLKHKPWNWHSMDSEFNKNLEDITKMYCMAEKTVRAATNSIQGPFFYSLFPPEADSGKQRKYDEQDIVFFDVPGEFFINGGASNKTLVSFLKNADGIIFLVNTAEMLQSNESAYYRSVVEILDFFTQQEIRDKRIAIVFNKLDEVAHHLDLQAIDDYVCPVTGNVVDIDAIQLKADNIRRNVLGGGSANAIPNIMNTYLENILQYFPNSCVFATRLIAELTNDEFRFVFEGAETPFLWLLAEAGAFPVKEKSKKRRG